ncbi:MAG: hypothetical protein ACJ8FY_23335 [Gemmataceae bacterium]
MTPFKMLTALLLGFLVSRTFATDKERTYLNLQPKANQKLKDTLHENPFENNNLAQLTAGKQQLCGVVVDIGEGFIQLGSTQVKDKPDRVDGIPVGRNFARLHILHATGHSTDDNTVIGFYVIHYGDKTSAACEVVYGQDVRDWWYGEEDKEPTRAKVAWKGENESAKLAGRKIRLYLSTWENPKPDKKVVSIDYVAAEATICAPFCVAMTVE